MNSVHAMDRFLVVKRIFIWVLILLPAFSYPSLELKSPDFEKNDPLVMENADRFEGYRSRGEYILTGKVRFRHGALRLETERAVWLKDRNIVYCESGMRVVHRGAVLTADRGNYDKNRGEASAEGNVFMRDSSGEVEATGRNIVYSRNKHFTTMTGEPILRRFYPIKDSVDSLVGQVNGLAMSQQTLKSLEKSKPASGPASGPVSGAASSPVSLPASALGKSKNIASHRDTLSIRGDIMTYDDSSQVAVADGKVRIDRNKLKITCKKAEYHDAADSLFLLGEPVVIVDGNQVQGQVMRLGMHGEDIRSLLVKGSAQAHSLEPATDSSSARQSDVKGDSLFLVFKEKAIDSVQVFKNATGAYYDVDKPNFVNKMSGEYMVMRFVRKQVSSANVIGGAKSTYYHFEQKRLKGRNEAEGDSIDFVFKSGKIDEVMVKGQAKGTYFGERQLIAKADSVAAQPDSTRRNK